MKQCPECGNEYERVAGHWALSSCDWPSFTTNQKDIITGLMLGDGCINNTNANPSIRVEMISPNYLEHLDQKFGVFGNGVRLHRTAEESAKQSRETGFRPDANEDNYSDVYKWESTTHPELQQFSEWYSTGEKVWPEYIELTPTVLKHWYVGDGTYENTNSNNRIRIACSNEINRTENIENTFEKAGLPIPYWNIGNRKNGTKTCTAVFKVDQSEKLWEYMGDPLPDFEYKWPEEYR